MAVRDFLPFATGGGANVESQATYAADATTGTGFVTGVAASQKLNKVWRQSSFVSAAIAQFMLGALSVDILDDGNLSGFVANFIAALRSQMFSPQSIGVNGYISFPNVADPSHPVHVQWGYNAGGSSETNIAYNTPFSTTTFIVLAQALGGDPISGAANMAVVETGYGTGSFDVFTFNAGSPSSSVPFFWFAIGT